MIYFAVMITSGIGILAIIALRGILRSRNVRRIARSVRKGFSSVEQRNAKLLPEIPAQKIRKSPRICAVELQQVRTFIHEAEKAIAKHDKKAAERFLIQALTLHPEAADIKVRLAHIYLESGREPKAEAIYRELLQSTEDPAIFGNLGLLCYREKRYTESCELYQKALDLDPKNPERSHDLGHAYFAAKNFQESAPILEKAAKSLPHDLDLLRLLAQCYVQMDDVANAVETYRRINKLDPRDESVKEWLAKLVQVA